MRKVWAVRREGGMEGGRRGLRDCPRPFRHGGAAELRGAWERPRGEPRAGGAESVAPLQPLGELGAGERRAARAVCVRVCVCVGVVSVAVCPPSAPRSVRRCPSALLSARC